ncbi:MAG: hypothetical protein FJ207_15820, partial [Gemmatimonadetes bacterium]|nr:hypothetical protein [Gemmatimonadota bacterium]
REDYGFTGKEEDVEVGLTYFGKRFLSAPLGRWMNPDPLAVHSPADPKADLNLYAYVNGQALLAIDETGLFPTKDLATTASRWRAAFERKPVVDGKVYDRGGTTSGAAALRTLKAYGETTGRATSENPTGKTLWMSGATPKHPTAESERFVYTTKGGWIDMVHFMFYAGRARMHREAIEAGASPDPMENQISRGACIDAVSLARNRAVEEGRQQETLKDSPSSKFSYEDLPSDYFGADFGARYFDPKSSKSLAEQAEGYLKTLGATSPERAPNWSKMPSGDPMALPPPPERNETTKPMHTTE